jgi:hypothetical protein
LLLFEARSYVVRAIGFAFNLAWVRETPLEHGISVCVSVTSVTNYLLAANFDSSAAISRSRPAAACW